MTFSRRFAYIYATDAQRSYLRRLGNKAERLRIDIGLGDFRRFVDSDRLLKSDASQQIERIKQLLEDVK